MLKELDQVVLTQDLEDEDLRAGDVGVIVHIHPGGDPFQVEFFTVDGNTLTVATVPASDVRLVTPEDVLHARPACAPSRLPIHHG